MLPIGSVSSAYGASPLTQIPTTIRPASTDGIASPQGGGFGQMLQGLVNTVESKQATADKITQTLMSGDSGQLHQGVIAMQEASVAFSLMVQVRNKLVDSYQELMRMQA